VQVLNQSGEHHIQTPFDQDVEQLRTIVCGLRTENVAAKRGYSMLKPFKQLAAAPRFALSTIPHSTLVRAVPHFVDAP
jgi:hypothetical protein